MSRGSSLLETPWGGGGLGGVGLAAALGGIWSSSRMGPLLSRAPCVQGRSSACPPHQHGAINKVSSSKFKAGELEAGRLAGAEKREASSHPPCLLSGLKRSQVCLVHWSGGLALMSTWALPAGAQPLTPAPEPAQWGRSRATWCPQRPRWLPGAHPAPEAHRAA